MTDKTYLPPLAITPAEKNIHDVIENLKQALDGQKHISNVQTNRDYADGYDWFLLSATIKSTDASEEQLRACIAIDEEDGESVTKIQEDVVFKPLDNNGCVTPETLESFVREVAKCTGLDSDDLCQKVLGIQTIDATATPAGLPTPTGE